MAAKLQPGEARFGLELDWEKLWRHQVFGAKMSETSGNKRLSFARDSEEVFGSESATRGGSFWTRIRLGKAVASPGVRGQDERMSETNGNRRLFFLRPQEVRSGGLSHDLHDDFCFCSGTECAMFLGCNIPCLTRTSLAVGGAVFDSNSSMGLG